MVNIRFNIERLLLVVGHITNYVVLEIVRQTKTHGCVTYLLTVMICNVPFYVNFLLNKEIPFFIILFLVTDILISIHFIYKADEVAIMFNEELTGRALQHCRIAIL